MSDTLDTALENWLARRGSRPGLRVGTEGRQFGNWKLLAFIGRGGSGEVWRAEHVITHRVAAIKLLHRTEGAYRRRFESAIRFLSANRNPGYPKFYDCGDERGISFVVMEELQTIPKLPDTDRGVAKFLTSICKTVAELHSRGFVHRDIKPSNVMMRKNEEYVLIDLGLLKDISPKFGETSVDAVSLVDGKAVALGTPGYAAPEQLTTGECSPASDIHALGVMADSCFRGNPPKCWEKIIRRCTSSLPSQRFPSVGALISAVKHRHALRNWLLVSPLLLALGLLVLLIALGAIVSSVRQNRSQSLPPSVSVVPPAVTNAPEKVVGDSVGAGEVKVEVADGDDVRLETFRSILSALAVCGPNAKITVGPGVYEEHFAIDRYPVELIAPAGPEKTTIRGEKGHSVIKIAKSASGTKIEGFTVTGGTGEPVASSYGFDYYGGGLDVDGSTQIVNCIIEGNGKGTPRRDSATFGGGVYAAAQVTMIRCVVRDNFAWACGGGVMSCGNAANVDLRECTVEGNGSTDFFGNQAGVGVSHGGIFNMDRCAVFGNRGDQLGAFGAPFNRDTRAFVGNSYVEGNPLANGIQSFNAPTPWRTKSDYLAHRVGRW